MFLFPIPKGIMEKIIKIQRNFLWNGNSGKKSPTLVSWSVIVVPKNFGGLNIGNIHHKNIALLFKWLWRFLNEPHSLWRQQVQVKYGFNLSFSAHDFFVPKVGGPGRGYVKQPLVSHLQKICSLMASEKNIGDDSD